MPSEFQSRKQTTIAHRERPVVVRKIVRVVSRRDVRRLIPYAFHAPPIVEAICEGRQPPDLTVEHLMRCARLPYQCAEQHSALGLVEQFS